MTSAARDLGLGVDTPFDVAISYAGEDRAHAEAIANGLARAGVRVYYDVYEQGSLWGHNLYEHLADIYGRRARYCVMLVSKSYAAKVWTNHERQAAQARALRDRDQAYILPIRIDDTPIPGLPETIGYLSIQVGAERIVSLLLQKLQIALPPRHAPTQRGWWVAAAALLALGSLGAGAGVVALRETPRVPSTLRVPPPPTLRPAEPEPPTTLVAVDPPETPTETGGQKGENRRRERGTQVKPPVDKGTPGSTATPPVPSTDQDLTTAIKEFGGGDANLIDKSTSEFDRVLGGVFRDIEAKRQAEAAAKAAKDAQK